MASLPINYGTSYYALKRRANAQSGESLLVLGASGGIGTATIQLAKVMGLKTICAVGSDNKEEYVKSLGGNPSKINFHGQWIALRDRLKSKGIIMVSKNFLKNNEPDLEIHLNASKMFEKKSIIFLVIS